MKILLVGLTIAAVVVGGGWGYSALTTSGDSFDLPGLGSLRGNEASDGESSGEKSRSDSRTNESEPEVAREPDRPAEPGDVVITEEELNNLMTEAIASQPDLAPILEAGGGVTTNIENGRIESGVVMNLNDVPLEALPAEGKSAIEELTATFPFLADRDVYVGIEGSPKVVEGAFSLDDTNVRLGQLKLPAGSVASQLGVSQGEIEAQITAVLESQGLTPEDIRVNDGEIVISGLPR